MAPHATARLGRLASETSAYLRQHASNPVDWYPWGAEALERAVAEDRPILLSIGYAACHWCHVMEHESFANAETAALMNAHFVCIKVDREERPDLDDIYMTATVAMSGAGGWPMTLVLTPKERRPIFAGTYFPPDDRHGRPGFRRLLRTVAQAWRDERQLLLDDAARLTGALSRRAAAHSDAPVDVVGAISQAVAALGACFDPCWGGFSPAPKFPQPTTLELLLIHHQRQGDAQALDMARRTLDAMAAGGIRDHLGGGFARYSTDARWLVPHFEKMLTDNALLAKLYAHAHQLTGDPSYRRVAIETLDWVSGELCDARGLPLSSLDADSEGEEGRYYLWTAEQIEACLEPEQARALSAYYSVTEPGDLEGRSVLHTPHSRAEVAAQLGLDPVELDSLLTAARARLGEQQRARARPATDDKIVTAYAAMMIGAWAEGGRVLGEPRFIASASVAADALLGLMRRPDGGLYRTARGERAHLDGYLADYAHLASALVDLYEAGGELGYLREAERLVDRLWRDFSGGPGQGLYATAGDHEPLLWRPRGGTDGALPSPAAVAASALGRLGQHLERPALCERARQTVAAFGALIARAPEAFATGLMVLDRLERGSFEAVLVGDRAAQRTHALANALRQHALPSPVIVHADGRGASDRTHPLARHKTLVGGEPTLYLCHQQRCAAPITEPAAVAAALGAFGLAGPGSPAASANAPLVTE